MKGKKAKKLAAGIMSAVMMCSASSSVYAASPSGISLGSVKSADAASYFYDFEDGDVSAFSKRGDTDTSVISAYVDSEQGNVMAVTGRTNNWNGPQIRVDTILEPGVKYKVSAKVKTAWYNTVNISMQKNDAEGNASYSNLAKGVSQGDWITISTKFTLSQTEGSTYLYIEGSDGADLYVDDFSIEAEPETHPESDIAGLKDVYAKYFKFGTAVTESELAPSATKELILKHFNSITLGNELKPENMLDKAGCIANAEAGNGGEVSVKLNNSARTVLNFARDNNISVRGHVLVWHSQTPGWFFKENYDENGDYVDKETMLARMESYIKGVFEVLGEEYPDVDFYAWDVVNEAWLDDGQPRRPGTYEEAPQGNLSGWTAVFGDNSFIPYAFEYARKYAPEGTKLYYNDFNEYMPQKTAAIVEMANELKEKGLIDGIGMQSHLDARSGSDAFPSVSAYEKALKAFTETGLDVQITELDVTVNDNTLFDEQAKYYSDIMDAIVKYADNISAVVVWGTTDDQSWRSSKYPLLFNEDYTAKPSYYQIVDGIDYDQPTTTTTTTAASTTTTTTDATTTTTGGDILYGDANCDEKVDVSDAVMILQALANTDKYGVDGTDPTHITEQGMINADCNLSRDGVTTADALSVQKKVVGLIELPIE